MEDYYTKLEIPLREYSKLRSVYENLEEYENEYMVPIVHPLRYYYGEFKKKITYQKLTRQGLRNIGKTVEIMAAAENLDAHQRAVSIRLAEIQE